MAEGVPQASAQNMIVMAIYETNNKTGLSLNESAFNMNQLVCNTNRLDAHRGRVPQYPNSTTRIANIVC